VTSYTEGFSHFVTSMTAPVASGWSVRRVGLSPTGKRRLLTAHTFSGHSGSRQRTLKEKAAVRENAIRPFWRGQAAGHIGVRGLTNVGCKRGQSSGNGIGLCDGQDECWREDQILRYWLENRGGRHIVRQRKWRDWNSPTREDAMRFDVTGIALAFSLVAVPALADDTIKIGYIDPLSGGGASIGEVGLKTYQYLADEINASGGLLGKKVEIVAFDNKTNPQESLIQAQKAADQGIHIITQGNGSSVAAALTDWVSKYNDRNPGKEILYLNYAAVDPVLTNDKCSYWHFRWDANSDIKMAALTYFMKDRPNIKKVYLINQDYSFGQAVHKEARAMLKEKRPDIEIVGDELHPLLKITDFSPYIAKIRASGADSVVTGNWG
jgi:hypothetical protein